MMMALGMFVFGLPTLAYQELQRTTEWRHASTSRIGTNPASQFLGRGEDTITLPGTLLPGLVGSPLGLDTLRLMADTGKSWPLVSGTGKIYGAWVITQISETQQIFFDDGTPRRYEFTINLKRIDDGRVDLLGTVTGVLGGVLRPILSRLL
ncbi:phage tail protein [Pseudomonas kuykendallii]|uniref:Oxidoreductase n=1 Tax=Pseudomonas kuykendallii TaxID=1007099 RepID=A0A2W5D8L1_9PSED|nr:phage tail protein [Pseudomonas kuykendallii]PZP26693.1 MAG: oxidoreductase [Pseudomonas kuykendallii]